MKAIANGASCPRTLSSATSWTAFAVLLPLVAGVLGLVLHAAFRWPLHWPGRHGLEWMALLTWVALAAPYRGAATVAGVSAALTAMLPLWGFHDPLMPVTYAFTALALDALFALRPRAVGEVIMPALLAALAFALKALSQWGIAWPGAPAAP